MLLYVIRISRPTKEFLNCLAFQEAEGGHWFESYQFPAFLTSFLILIVVGGWVADSIGGSNWAHINGSLSSKLPAKQDVHIIFVMILPCR